jgi:hypothetical protein
MQHKHLLSRHNLHQQASPGNARKAIAPDSKSGGGNIVLVRVRPGHQRGFRDIRSSGLRWLATGDALPVTEPEGPSFISRTVAQRRVDRRCS